MYCCVASEVLDKVLNVCGFLLTVTDFLNMCCSSILPGGGTNLEYGLHSLFQAKGNIMVREAHFLVHP